MLQFISKVAAEKLEIDPEELDADMNFLELGADSMVAISLIRNVEQALDIELYPTLLFEYPSINAFVGYLEETVPREKQQNIKFDNLSINDSEEEQISKAPCASENAVIETNDELSVETVMQLFQEQQTWFKDQFQAQHDEIDKLRQLINDDLCRK